jgi:polyisoprenoid-binding protein YceI
MSVIKFSFGLIWKSMLILGTTPALAATAKNCKVTFETVGKPVLVQIQGTSGAPCTGTYDVAGDAVTGTFVMKLDALETGIELRNKHLRENYLDTEQFPEASLTIMSISGLGQQLKGKSGTKATFVPSLTLRGVTKPIEGGTYEIDGKTVNAEFRIELTDFGIERPMFMGIKVVDAVIVRVQFEMGS